MPARGHWRWVLASLLLPGAHFLAQGSTEVMCRSIQQGLLTINNSSTTTADPKRKPRVALIYSGQVCRERVNPTRYEESIWTSNMNDMVVPLQATTVLKIFGRLVAGCDTPEHTAEAVEKVSAALPWTRLQWMDLDDTVDLNGDWRRKNALKEFIGEDWPEYDYIMHIRPDLVFNRPVHAWQGFNFNRIMYAHVETSYTDRHCVEAQSMDIPDGPDLAANIPQTSDAFLGYPSWYAPLMLAAGGVAAGRGGLIFANKYVRHFCSQYLDFRHPNEEGAGEDSAKPLWSIMKHVSG